jgi:transposase
MTEHEANALYDQGREAVVAYLVEITNRLKAIEARLAQNSKNSSKPPSSDPDNKNLKPMSLRGKTQKKPGGQKGHKGQTLRQVNQPDQTQDHHPKTCPNCQTDLQEQPSVGYVPRQVFEMPDPKIVVIEHRAHQVVCPCCNKQAQAAFPQGVNQPAAYGPRLLGFASYLHAQHLIPFARCAQIVTEITGAAFSPGSLHTALKLAYERLENFEEHVKETLRQSPILHVDETSARVAGKRYWFHVRCTSNLTYLFCHAKRGREALTDLLSYQGRLVSDFFSNYVTLACLHQFCQTHICRELLGVFEQTGQEWAKSLKEHLEACNAACHRARNRGNPKLWNARTLAAQFDELVSEGSRANPPATPVVGKRVRRSKARALVDRLREYRQDCLAFLFDLGVPFTNNQAERDIRMLKVKGKISGGFRRLEGARWFCRTRSYLQTCAKQGLNLLACLRSVFAGEPVLPSFQHA